MIERHLRPSDRWVDRESGSTYRILHMAVTDDWRSVVVYQQEDSQLVRVAPAGQFFACMTFKRAIG
jgi:hypothetical protein